MSPFQTQINQYPAPGVEGGRASNNPAATVVAGEGTLKAGASGVRVGGFAWNTSAGLANSYCYTGLVPNGFVANEQQALITIFLAETSQVVPAGYPITEYDRGDFWAKSVFGEAAIDNKVFANLLTGKIMAAATAAFPVNPQGVTGTITASFATSIMTVTATSVYLAPGMLITGGSVPIGTYISSQTGGSAGSTGTYQLTTVPGTIASAATVVATSLDLGGGTASSCSANSGSPTLTITTLTNGAVAKGMLVSGTSIPADTYISALGTSTGGTGTVTLSANTTDTISAATVLFSPWIETPWHVKSNGNVGDLIKIGVKN